MDAKDQREKIFVLDTTLRDGEQATGNSLVPSEKLEVARQLSRLKVDILEVGSPASSPGDFESARLIAQEIDGPVICALSRARQEDIDRCAQALAGAKRKRIHTGIGVSDIYIERKQYKSKDEVLKIAVEVVKHAKQYTEDVEFYAEDATRADQEFLFTILQAVIEAGATTVNIPDTIGYAIPEVYGSLISRIRERVPNIRQATLSVHCHNDLGLAVANSLAGLVNGARQVECSINGIGPRAGNASLEEVVMGISAHKDYFRFLLQIQPKELYRTSRTVAHLFGITIPRNKPIVGNNALTNNIGLHINGMMKDRLPYETINPEDIGFPQSRVILTARAGRHGLKHRLKELGYPPFSQDRLEKVYGRFMEIADRKQMIYDEDLVSIMENEVPNLSEKYTLTFLQVMNGTHAIPMATVKIKKQENGTEETVTESALGDGPVDAAYKAIDKAINFQVKLDDYTVQAVTSGAAAMAEVLVSVSKEGKKVLGHGSSTDIVEASVRAYLNGINKLVEKLAQEKRQPGENRQELVNKEEVVYREQK
ncbi:MAG: 2-isopropylmalate synthase [bacterium]|nr:2-isopropylmalate synthase [bacterium]